MAQRVPTAKLSSRETPEMTEGINNGMQPFESHAILICMVYLFYAYFAPQIYHILIISDLRKSWYKYGTP